MYASMRAALSSSMRSNICLYTSRVPSIVSALFYVGNGWGVKSLGYCHKNAPMGLQPAHRGKKDGTEYRHRLACISLL